MKRTTYSSSGFTMVEIALSIAIMSVGIVAVLGIMPTLLRSNRQALEFSNVAILAQTEMDSDNLLESPFDLNADMNSENTENKKLSGTATNDYFVASCFVTNYVSQWVDTEVTSAPLKGYTIKTINTNDTTSVDNPLLISRQVTYSWPPGATNTTSQRFTFYTEKVAKFLIPLPVKASKPIEH